MAKSIGEFIFDLAKKAGVPEDNEGLKTFILDKDLFNKPLPEDLQTGIDNSLISIKDATNNHPKIKNVYYAAFMDGVDKMIDPLLTGLDDEVKAEIKSENNTFKKIPLLFTKVKELESKKGSTPGKNDKEKEEMQKHIDALHTQLKEEKEITQTKEKEYEGKVKEIELRFALNSKFAGYKTIYDDLDPSIKGATLKAIFDKEVQDNKVKFSIDENGSIQLFKEDGTNFYGDNHQLITPESFIEKTLSRNKILKVSDQSGNNNTAPVNRNSLQPLPAGGNGNGTRNTTLQGLALQSLKDIDNSNAVNVM